MSTAPAKSRSENSAAAAGAARAGERRGRAQAGRHHPAALAARTAEPYPEKLTERLAHWAKAAPERIFLAQRDARRRLAQRDLWAGARERPRASRRLFWSVSFRAERPIAILSGNDIEHALLGLAAMHVGMPYAPISVPYSLVSRDFGKLKAIIEILTPGLVFAADGAAFAPAIAATVPQDVEVAVTANPASDRPMTPFTELLGAPPDGRRRSGAREGRTRDRGQDPVHLRLHRPAQGRHQHPAMLCANQAMIRGGLAFLGDGEPPVLVDWLPWNHTYGGNHDFGLVLDQRRLALYRRRKADAGRHRGDRRAICAISPRPSISTCRRASRCCCPHLPRIGRCARGFSAASS